jgi:transcriptional regulator with XRE-family HTH domain
MWKCGIRQNRLAQLIGIHETLLSKVVNGFRMPDNELRTRIASALGCEEEWLFTMPEHGVENQHQKAPNDGVV